MIAELDLIKEHLDYLKRKKTYSKKKKVFGEETTKYNNYRERHLRKYIDILRTMSEAERSALEEANYKNSVVLKHLKTCMSTSWAETISFKILSFELEGVWVRHRQWEDWGDRDGQYVNRKTLIPYLYFDKTYNQVKDLHTEWSMKRIEKVKLYQKKKNQIFSKKMKQEEEEAKRKLYLSLKKEFEDGN
jgi:hypothetical protein